MAGIPSPIRKWVKRYITGEGSSEVANQSPVQSVNSQTGDVTVSTGGGVIPSPQTVASYADLPLTDLSEAEIWFVTGEEDIVVSTQLSPVVWRSVSDFTVVAFAIRDVNLDHFYYALSIDDISTDWSDEDGSEPMSPVNSPSLGSINSNQSVLYDATNSEYHESTNAAASGSNNEWTMVAVFDLNGNGNNAVFQNGDDNAGWLLDVDFSNDRYSVVHGSVERVSGGSPDTNPHVLVATYEGTDSGTVIADLDGSQIINTTISDPNTPLNGGMNIGVDYRESDDSTFFLTDGDVGAAGHEAGFADQSRRDELTQKLGEAFGISYTV